MSRIDNYALFSADNAKAAPGSKQHKSAKAKQAVAQSPTPTPEPVAPEVAAPQPPTPKPPRAAASADADADGNQTWLKEFFADTHHENLMMLCKNFGLPFGDIPGLRTLAEAVVSEWELSATEHVSYNDFSRHLISTMRKKFNDSRRPSPSASSAPADTPPQAPASNYNFSGGFGGVDV
jgi:predicted lipid-binding transport protein (Tim44 family)